MDAVRKNVRSLDAGIMHEDATHFLADALAHVSGILNL